MDNFNIIIIIASAVNLNRIISLANTVTAWLQILGDICPLVKTMFFSYIEIAI